jgi:protein-S-isoprenylcysteine O-methyltransferase Ste14
VSGSRIPSLGPRGEGWVILQLAGITAVSYAGRLDPGGPTIDPGLRSGLETAGLIVLAASAVLLFSGVALLIGASSFSIYPRPISDGQLVESGPYAIVRHPVYSGLILGGFGFALQRASIATLLATFFLAAVLDLKRRREEAWLIDRFPAYAEYRRRTRALLPFLY